MDIFKIDLFLFEMVAFFDEERQVLDLLVKFIGEKLVIIAELLFHLLVARIVILLEDFSLFVFVMEEVVEALKETLELEIHISFQSRKVFKLFDPDVAVDCQFVLLLDVLWILLDSLKLGNIFDTFWRKF